MQDYGGLLAELKQQMDGQLREMERMSSRWQQGMDARLTDLDDQLTGLDGLRDDDVPPDAPAAFREVSEKFSAGELNWLTVWRGDTEDEDARAVSVWMDRRLVVAQSEFRTVEREAQR